MNFLVTQEQKLGTSSHQAPPEQSPVMQEQKFNMFIRRWGVQHRCSIWTLPLFQSWGFWPQILHQTAVFLNAERDMLLDLNKFPVPRVGNLTMLKKFTCRTFALNPPPPSLSKDWHLHNDNIFLIIFTLAEFTNLIQSYPRMCLHHCHKNRFLPNSSLCAFTF